MHVLRPLLLAATLIPGCCASMAQDGANDPTFNATDIGYGQGDGADGRVSGIIERPDGRILVCGEMSVYNYRPGNRIALLNANGTSDTTFNSPNMNGDLHAFALQPDGRIMVGGDFTYVESGTPLQRIMRLNADGSRDMAFMTPGSGVNDRVSAIALQADGKILIAGDFTLYNATSRIRIARLNAGGGLDGTFTTGAGADTSIRALCVQPDGNILIAGDFTSYDGTIVMRVARLDASGSLDPGFDPGAGADGPVNAMVLQPNGKILIGGGFANYDGTARNGIARLNTDGTLDGAFDPGTGVNAPVFTLALQPDGRCMVGGGFTSYDGTASPHIVRVNTDGSVDAGFVPGAGANDAVLSLCVQLDGTILAGGDLTNYDGILLNRIAHLHPDGSLDGTFNPNTGADDVVDAIAVQPDGRIIIGGRFERYNNTPCNHITRLNTDGSLDAGFATGSGADGWIEAIALQPDGKILIGGGYYNYDGTARQGIARLNTDGSLDTSFDPGTGVNGTLFDIVVQPDGKILIAGGFFGFDGSATSWVARLNADGSLDGSFTTPVNSAVLSIALQPDGKILIGAWYAPYRLTRLNMDGSVDPTFDPGTGPDDRVEEITVQPDGRILIGGEFLTYDGTLTHSVTRVNADGSLDATFNTGSGPSGSYGKVKALQLRPDGKILIGGNFTSFDGTSRNGIARMNADGSLDGTFDPGSGAQHGGTVPVFTLALQPDGRILAGGAFTSYDGTGRNRIARIMSELSTAVSAIAARDMTVFPNPGHGTFTVSTDIRGPWEMIVTDATGNLVLSGPMDPDRDGHFIVDLGDRSNGVYVVTLRGAERTTSARLVKE